MEIKRRYNNLIGRMLGYESCVFCGDRHNWKPWMDTISFRHTIKNKTYETFKDKSYDLPICESCFGIQPLTAVLHAVNADISQNNNFCRSFGAEPAYSDADQQLIMSAVQELKSQFGGT